jgi:outer membrane protein
MPKSFSRILGPLAAAIAFFAFSPDALAQAKIGVIDTQRAILETEDGLCAQATLKKLFDKRQHELDKKQVDLQKEREDIEKQRDVLSKGALQKRVEKWQREMVQLQTVFVDYNKELQKKQNELTQPIFSKAMNIIRRLASTDGYDMVLDKQAVPYVRSDLDLTDRVIQAYNAGGGAGDGKSDKSDKPSKAPGAKAPAGPALSPPSVTPPAAPKQ